MTDFSQDEVLGLAKLAGVTIIPEDVEEVTLRLNAVREALADVEQLPWTACSLSQPSLTQRRCPEATAAGAPECDWIPQNAHLVPNIRIVSSFIHNGQPGDIEAVMVDGRFIMRDGKVLTVDEEAVIAEADRIGRSAWDRLLRQHPSAEFPASVAPPLR